MKKAAITLTVLYEKDLICDGGFLYLFYYFNNFEVNAIIEKNISLSIIEECGEKDYEKNAIQH